LFIAACGSPLQERNCTQDIRPGIWLWIVDSATGLPLAAGALAVAQEGMYLDTLFNPNPFDSSNALVTGVAERAGTYQLTVSHIDYNPWLREGMHVTRGKCHVNPILDTAYLVPSPP
jgi:hypothetical protein